MSPIMDHLFIDFLSLRRKSIPFYAHPHLVACSAFLALPLAAFLGVFLAAFALVAFFGLAAALAFFFGAAFLAAGLALVFALVFGLTGVAFLEGVTCLSACWARSAFWRTSRGTLSSLVRW